MSTIFTINFRREAYQMELARTRRRTVAVGAWVAYFGVLAVVLGLYGLNCGSLLRRARQLESQNTRLRSDQGPQAAWQPAAAEIAQVERVLANPRLWQTRLARLATLLPPNAALSTVSVNPDNLSGGGEHDRLVITGVLRPTSGQDRMQGIMQLLSTLRGDSEFAANYRTIKLAESRIGGPDAPAEFRIECR
jgi:hypothetical protein